MLHVYKTSAMQSILLAVKHGYVHASTGIVEADSLKAFHNKIYRRYNINRSRAAICKDRKKNRPVVKLVMYPCNEYFHPTAFHWFLLSTKELDEERLWDVRKTPLVFGSEYELTRLTMPGHQNAIWTWRFHIDYFNHLREKIDKLIKWKNERELNLLIRSIYSAPHFRGVRNQRKQIAKQINNTWKHVYRKSVRPPKLPKNKFKRMVKNVEVKQIARFVNGMNQNNRSALAQMQNHRRNLEIRIKRGQS